MYMQLLLPPVMHSFGTATMSLQKYEWNYSLHWLNKIRLAIQKFLFLLFITGIKLELGLKSINSYENGNNEYYNIYEMFQQVYQTTNEKQQS